MTWIVESPEPGIVSVVNTETGRRITIAPRSVHPAHLAHARRAAFGLCAQLAGPAPGSDARAPRRARLTDFIFGRKKR